MILLVGHYSLILSLLLATIIFFISTLTLNYIFKLKRKYFNTLIILYYIFINITFFSLLYLYIISDFRLIIVLENSNVTQPLIYKICSLWSNLEGSFILWVWCLTTYLYLFILINKYIPYFIILRLVMYFSFFLVFYLYLIIMELNPFTRLFVLTFIDNQFELNPQLQDYKLLIHPPLIYLGYSGSIIGFIFVLLIINNTNIYLYIEKVIKIWLYITWIFLSLGIITGSHWAYYELGWGGWWFWDPVENISLIPWIFNTISIHLCLQSGTKNRFKHLFVFTLLLTYISCIFGNILIKSGKLQTVHNFIQVNFDTTIIINIIIILSIFLVYLFIKIHKFNHYLYISILSNNDLIKMIIFITYSFIFILIYLTCFPLISKYFFNINTYIREETINEILRSLLLPIILFFLVRLILNFKNNIKPIKSITVILISYIITIFFFNYIYKLEKYFIQNYNSFFLLILISFVIISLSYLYYRIWILKKTILLTHISFFIFIIVLFLSKLTQFETLQFIDVGDTIKFLNYFFTFVNIYEIEEPNIFSTIYKINIVKNNLLISTIFVEKKYFYIQNQIVNKNIIETGILNDFNIFLIQGFINEQFTIKIQHNFLISLIWITWYLMILSIFISITENLTKSFSSKKLEWI